MTYDIITLGGIIQDTIFFIEKGRGSILKNEKNSPQSKFLAFKLDTKIYIKEAYLGVGGGAANTVVSFSNLGLRSAIIACLGKDDLGRGLISFLQKKGIETKFIQQTNKKITGFSLVCSLPGRDKVIFSFRGADQELKTPNFKNFKTKWFYISSLSSENWQKFLERVLRTKSQIAFNPGQIQLGKISALKKFLPKIDVLLLNRMEAGELIQKDLEIKDFCQAIYSLGPKIIAITDGPAGAATFDGKNYYFQKSPDVKVANTTGAGDAFGSAFVASLIYQQGNLKRALNWGIKNSVSVIQKLGAQNGLLKLKDLI